ncbi:MAG: hypothetical protein HKN12_12075 [Gemmatimonadetes bacterium]|nr:hypothetical protein [Gemmatimonadota bacterium]
MSFNERRPRAARPWAANAARTFFLLSGVFALTGTLGAAGAVHAAEVSGLADFLIRNASEVDRTNINFRPTSNLDTYRVRVFVDGNVAENTDFFTQLSLSQYADAFIFAAYLRAQEIGGTSLNLNIGVIPNTIGTFTSRTYSDRNPLVGVPLVVNHHTVLSARTVQATVADLQTQRMERSQGGLPVLYDNCWNAGAELYGEAGSFDWSVAVLAGSASHPTRAQPDKLPQGSARIGWYRSAAFQLGASGWVGPYMFEGNPNLALAPAGKNQNDYLNGGFGYDLFAGFRYLEIHSEVYRTFWQHPALPTLNATSGYAEAKYKFAKRWYFAGRFGFLEPDKVPTAGGGETAWDYPVHRTEYGFGFRASRRVLTKLIAQHNRFDGNAGLATNHVMAQLSAAF